ncbi:MAG: PhzF family phenazine biosynthesis protein [Acidimicrobiia bacterium]
MTQIYVVDAFSDAPFRGNPAGVVLLESAVPDAWMQSVAAELRHSETAFVGRLEKNGIRTLRWFTPVAEVELCGHATIASAHVLGASVKFDTLSGILTCEVGESGVIWMNLPADPPERVSLASLDLRFVERCNVVAAARGRFDLLLELESEAEVRQAIVKYENLAAKPYRGLILTAAGGRGADIVSRCFYPSVGVPEDPVTGSAHCTLACWWSGKLFKGQLVAEQASTRGGTLKIELVSDRVWLGGICSTVIEGTLVADTATRRTSPSVI